jgi:cell division protein FtsL
MKYASRSAVSGNNAYDLGRIRAAGYRSATVATFTLPLGTAAPKTRGTRPQEYAPAAAAGRSNVTRSAAARSGAAVRPAYAPEVKPARRPEESRAKKPARKAVRRRQKAYGLSLFAVCGFALVAVMMVFVLLSHIKYNEITSEVAQLQTRLAALNEEERKLKIAYEDAFDVNEVETYATNVLGMTKPLDSQLATVATAASDKAVVLATSAQENSRTSIGTFLMSLVSYFK